MELPKYHESFIPILEVLNKKGTLSSRELTTSVRDNYYQNLPKNLLDKKTSTGANILLDRISWGKSYLKMAKFVSYPERGKVQITQKGKEALIKGKLSLNDLKNDFDFIKHRQSVKSKKANYVEIESENLEHSSPLDLIESGISTIEAEVKTELLEKLKELDPYYFEKVILKLLEKMGYGDLEETAKSGDGGIDGVINQDKLGLEKIYTQAKRYTDTQVREKDIRNFIGAMSGDTRKGVFITTSSFHSGAIKKAKEAHHSIILIDGEKLVDLMHSYDVGVQEKNSFKIKEVDLDFFEGN